MGIDQSLFVEDDCEVITTLTDEVAAQVGRVAARWAYLEWLLRLVAYRASGVSDPIGRVALRDPRSDEMVTMITDLAMLRGIELKTETRPLRKSLEELKPQRDGLVHGLWVRNKKTGEMAVMDFAGTWNLGPHKPRMTKKMNPTAQTVTVEYLDSVSWDIEVAIETVKALSEELMSALNASLEKSVLQSLTSYRLRDQT